MGHIFMDAALVFVGLALILVYAKRGFFKSLIHSLKTVLALVAAYFLGGKLAELLNDAFIFKWIRGGVFDKVNALYLQASDSLTVQNLSSSFPSFIMSEEVKMKISTAEESGEALVNTVTDAIASPISNVISTVIGYVLVFVLALIALWIAAGLLDKLVEHIPLLNTANVILGALLGVVLAFALLFAVGSVLRYFLAGTELYAKSIIMKFFGESSVLDSLKFLDIGNLLG